MRQDHPSSHMESDPQGLFTQEAESEPARVIYPGVNRKERRHEAKLERLRLKHEAKQRKKNLYPEQL